VYFAVMLTDDSIQSMGGKARDAALSDEQKSAIAKKAAEARWGLPRVICGTPDRPLRIGDATIPCYVLEGERRVLVQGAIISAMGMARGSSSKGGGDRLAHFVNQKLLNPFISDDLRNVTASPLKFITPSGSVAHGYEAEFLAKLCFAVLDAERAGIIQKQQEHIARQCRILIEGFSIVGINALVDEATGYQEVRDKQALAKILERYLMSEARKWDRMFQIDYYKELFRLQGWTFDPSTNARTPYLGKLTNNIVYDRLQPGVLKKLDELNPRIPRADGKSRRKYTHHQFFTGDVGVPELKEHLSNVTILMKVSRDWGQFIEMLDRVRPRVGDSLRLALEYRD
jgi:hypothetical protein